MSNSWDFTTLFVKNGSRDFLEEALAIASSAGFTLINPNNRKIIYMQSGDSYSVNDERIAVAACQKGGIYVGGARVRFAFPRKNCPYPILRTYQKAVF